MTDHRDRDTEPPKAVCRYCHGVRLVGWSGAGPILCPECSDGQDAFSAVTQAWREQRSRVVELEREMREVTSERDAVRQDYLAVCEAIGVVYAADGQPTHPGPLYAVLGAVAALKRAQAEVIEHGSDLNWLLDWLRADQNRTLTVSHGGNLCASQLEPGQSARGYHHYADGIDGLVAALRGDDG